MFSLNEIFSLSNDDLDRRSFLKIAQVALKKLLYGKKKKLKYFTIL